MCEIERDMKELCVFERESVCLRERKRERERERERMIVRSTVNFFLSPFSLRNIAIVLANIT